MLGFLVGLLPLGPGPSALWKALKSGVGLHGAAVAAAVAEGLWPRQGSPAEFLDS